jgi:hypothetical protein
LSLKATQTCRKFKFFRAQNLDFQKIPPKCVTDYKFGKRLNVLQNFRRNYKKLSSIPAFIPPESEYINATNGCVVTTFSMFGATPIFQIKQNKI